ncbi:hypothetical protein RT723_06400, partial [Psychrosphaera aquimarina]|nr:hypothetical protein [Psychrosphaera aquimarina]
DESKTVFENVMEGVADKKAILDRYNELMMNYSDETADEGAQLQDVIDSQNLWDLDSQVEMAMEALRCPPGESSVENLSGGEIRRVALCKFSLASLICYCSMSQPTTWTLKQLSARSIYANIQVLY